MLNYLLHEQSCAALAPVHAASQAMRFLFNSPLNPHSHTIYGRAFAAGCEVSEYYTRRRGKPQFNIKSTIVAGNVIPVHEKIVWQRPFCRLRHFEPQKLHPHQDRKLLIVAPLSGHYATLLRGTVEAMLPQHSVYITDWSNARDVPLTQGGFDLDDCIDYLVSIFRALGPNLHVMAVCQPAVPVLAAVSLMEEICDPYMPASIILLGGPIDTRVNPTVINRFAEQHGAEWFRQNVITRVPFLYPGFQRNVYPGFIQLSGFMSMNLDRHITRNQEFFLHLMRGDQDSAQKHRAFYDEYLAVMDLTAEFFLQTIETVFVHHRLAKGEMTHRRGLVRPLAIRHVALMTIEGQNDDICGVGQTEAAHGLCGNLSASMREHYVQPEVGHYGLFSGSRFRREIAPRISEFISKAKAPSRGRLAARQRRMTERAILGCQPQQSRRTTISAGICHGNAFSDRLVINRRGSVTLPNIARNKSPGTSGSRRSDDFTPCLHGRCPEGSVRSC